MGQYRGGNEKFYSGSGSHKPEIIQPYIDLLIKLIAFNDIRRIVDVGCGDFWIMRQVLGFFNQNKYKYFYHGIDVVSELIEHNSQNFGNDNVKFTCADASKDDVELPDGDLLIIRQVLQHLCNSDVKKILRKTGDFKYLLITEHIFEGENTIPNLDKQSIKAMRGGSGIFLEHAPFNYKNIIHLLKVFQGGGMIRTSLIIQ